MLMPGGLLKHEGAHTVLLLSTTEQHVPPDCPLAEHTGLHDSVCLPPDALHPWGQRTHSARGLHTAAGPGTLHTNVELQQPLLQYPLLQ